jgi:hypothetical protein
MPETIDFIRREIAGGRAIRETAQLANKEGHRTTKGEPISYRVVQRYLSKVVDKLMPVEAPNSFAEFIAKHIRPKKRSKVQAGAIHSGYKLWCRKRGIEPISPRKSGDWLRANKMTAEIRSGYVWYDGIEILNYPSVLDAKGEWATTFDNGIRSEKVPYQARR